MTEPPFWNDQLDRIPLCVELRDNFAAIKDELVAFISKYHPFMDYPKYADLYVNSWKAFPLSIFQGEHIELSKKSLSIDPNIIVAYNRSKLPLISSLIQRLEKEGHLRNVFVSKLSPGSIINPHRGWTGDYLRVHLGLICDPACRITVGGVTHTWSPGELLAFKDGGPYPHSVRHEGTRDRIVLSTDLSLKYVSQFIPGILETHSAAIGDVPRRTAV